MDTNATCSLEGSADIVRPRPAHDLHGTRRCRDVVSPKLPSATSGSIAELVKVGNADLSAVRCCSPRAAPAKAAGKGRKV